MKSVMDNLPDEIKHQAEKILSDIERAGSIIIVVKKGAQANGFVMGIACCSGLSPELCDELSLHFDQATEKKLKSLTLGL
ncbi:hypothetical protein BK668_18420 [Pseudomonas fluorescens]|nr:hypothetical protein BK668_18420 [Pseudomonas fluorescens]